MKSLKKLTPAIALAWLPLSALTQNSAPMAEPVPNNIPAAQDIARPGVIQLSVDATDVTRGIFSVSETIPVTAGGPLTLRADIINLFDKEYEIRDGTGVGVGAPQFGPRRGVFAGVSKAF